MLAVVYPWTVHGGYGYGYLLGPSPVPPNYCTSRIASAPCLARVDKLHAGSAVPQARLWRGTPDLPGRRNAHFVVPHAHAARAKGGDVVLFGTSKSHPPSPAASGKLGR